MPRLLPFERAEIEEEIQGHLAAGTWSMAVAREIALQRGLAVISVYEARARVVSRMARLRASDLEGERALAMMQIDAVVKAGMDGQKPQLAAVVSALRLKVGLMGLLDRPPEDGDGAEGGEAGQILDIIEKARRLGEQIVSPVVDEDEEDDSAEDGGDDE